MSNNDFKYKIGDKPYYQSYLLGTLRRVEVLDRRAVYRHYGGCENEYIIKTSIGIKKIVKEKELF